MEAHLVEGFHKILCVFWAEWRQAVWGLFSPQCGGNDEGNEPRFDPQLHKVFLRDRRVI
jgi:hypothetical protein